MTQPLIIEAAINGGTTKVRNPHVPLMPEEIAADALACIEAGAAIVHNHLESFALSGEAAVARYMEGWAPVLAADPQAILYATLAGGKSFEDRFGHYAGLAGGGARMGTFDPGSVNLASHGADGLPGKAQFVYATSHADIAGLVELHAALGLGPSIAIYEPGWLRTTLAWYHAGKLPHGAFIKFYFNGPYNFLDGQRSNVGFGLPPTPTALAAYLEMMEGCDIPWAVAVPGGDVLESGLARLAIEKGGHVRVGLEDWGGEGTPRNAELVAQIVELAQSIGRPVAGSKEAAELLKLP
jgi:3-keto-5-aminohexanoate cleavage enzyme